MKIKQKMLHTSVNWGLYELFKVVVDELARNDDERNKLINLLEIALTPAN